MHNLRVYASILIQDLFSFLFCPSSFVHAKKKRLRLGPVTKNKGTKKVARTVPQNTILANRQRAYMHLGAELLQEHRREVYICLAAELKYLRSCSESVPAHELYYYKYYK